MSMNDDTNDMMPGEFRDNIPSSLDNHLRTIMNEGDLNQFTKELPDGFLKDAGEGLQLIKDDEQLKKVLQHLNQQMHLQLSHKKKNPKRRAMGNMSWTYWAVLLILLLAIVGFVLVRMSLRH
jgi:hypothetical protein